jgi:hypothetical protein
MAYGTIKSSLIRLLINNVITIIHTKNCQIVIQLTNTNDTNTSLLLAALLISPYLKIKSCSDRPLVQSDSEPNEVWCGVVAPGGSQWWCGVCVVCAEFVNVRSAERGGDLNGGGGDSDKR